MARLCVFCGSRTGVDPAHARVAEALGRGLAAAGVGLVTGGGSVGLMGVVADAALAGGGEAVGVIPRALVEREVGHARLSEMHVVETMHQRKALMATLADAFVALPGGIGTFEELFEAWTWATLGYHAKPVALLNSGGYYDDLVAFLDRAVGDGFLRPDARAALHVADTPEALLDALAPALAAPGSSASGGSASGGSAPA